MTALPSFATPTLEDFTSDTETLVHVFDGEPDDLGRQRFVIYWVADNTGRKLSDRGVRGGLQRDRLDDFVEKTELAGGKVRFI